MSKALEVIPYGSSILVVRENSVDVVDTETGKWYVARSIRSAKWNVTVWSRLKKSFTPR